jgi:integrase
MDRLGMDTIEAVEAWVADLRRLGRASKYRRDARCQMLRMIDGCGWPTLGSIRSDSLIAWLAAPQRMALSGRSRNAFLETAHTFVKWCCAQRPLPWMSGNPLAGIARSDESEKRQAKRALKPAELVRLKNVSGPRWPVYLTACLTGLRRSELRRLEWGDVRLDSDRPHIQLRAPVTKARRADVVPINPQLLELLRSIRPQGARGDTRVFPTLPKHKTVRADMARAAIPWRDEQGRMVGLHATRKTYATMLAQAGTPIRVAMDMLRVTNVRLLTETYTDATLLNTAAAADKLPRLAELPAEDSGQGAAG